mmetsp:Transcript_6321/g.9296  ORF Transcript_6321/g.9296 Transcript_6321/m.9296 type:complete len:87 (+) Transcript_6321:45-305(+)
MQMDEDYISLKCRFHASIVVQIIHLFLSPQGTVQCLLDEKHQLPLKRKLIPSPSLLSYSVCFASIFFGSAADIKDNLPQKALSLPR